MVSLWISIHKMEVGCGLEVRRVNGRRYLYLWCYRRCDGRSGRRWAYLGAIGRRETADKAARALAEEYEAVRTEMERRLAVIRSKMVHL